MIGQPIVLECGQDFLYNERSKICCILCSAIHDALSEPAVFGTKGNNLKSFGMDNGV